MIGASDPRSLTVGPALPRSPRQDIWLILSVVALLIVGMMSLASIGMPAGNYSLVKKQGLMFLIGIIPFLLLNRVEPGFWRKVSGTLYIVNLVLLAAVLFAGASAKGAARWIDFGLFQFQPSEAAKLLLILTLSSFYASRLGEIKRFSTFVLGFLHTLPLLILVYKQPHLGATIVLLVAWLGISICAGVPWRFLFAAFASLVVLAGLVFTVMPRVLKGYQWDRVSAMFVHDERGKDFQQSRAAVAFGVGGVLGVGFGQGELKAGKYVPEQHNDFIFTVVGEEAGLVGCTLVLAAFSVLFYRAWLIIFKAADPYSRMLAAGVFSVLAFHTVVNLGMNLQLFPVVGLWLPFLSSGGTALWLCLACVGLLLNLHRHEKISL